MWLRLAGALLVTLATIGALEYFGVSRVLGGRSPDEVGDAARGRTGELFWLMIFFVVMATSMLAAARRWAGHLRRAVAISPPQRRRRTS
ncbi:MAG: hypothetical protein JWR47_2885 [Phenylobacterium sp.]|jgi:hypothetical protein|nr:hypothetical protein [Phenylobacterium sp.]MDB5436628.1 hypothetical protein [Phenylobacterium sp.]MDB5464182.1 hypothetical protein [Phenylobacterium sp.]MDB5496840.1 hypothetical protein [Phenylobacterium sp.]